MQLASGRGELEMDATAAAVREWQVDGPEMDETT